MRCIFERVLGFKGPIFDWVKGVVQHLRKVLKILLIIVSIGAIFLIGFLLLGITAIQDKYEPEQFKNETEIFKNQQAEPINNIHLIEFLEKSD
ncbi:hypothetical protein [Sediminibacter sp. Hel_I_10]|uniref:hypothetical protein n=1 Tax=Sediminibacter sp. Hel_I_10 TaxID=1392490 RepID=UPI000479607D|nr:hypothetical protein [Sediminibacter sp. Hel_I_10]